MLGCTARQRCVSHVRCDTGLAAPVLDAALWLGWCSKVAAVSALQQSCMGVAVAASPAGACAFREWVCMGSSLVLGFRIRSFVAGVHMLVQAPC